MIDLVLSECKEMGAEVIVWDN
ncbi:MAG: hypothetical protein ACKVHF_04200, partial [Candidatus Poseidoniales archaeon]